MYISGGRKNGKIKFALEDDIYLIDRLTLIWIFLLLHYSVLETWQK